MPKRRIDPAEGISAVNEWKQLGEETPRHILLKAVRFSLEELEHLHPGRAVEVRVPPAGAVQILAGTTHRRGTPPAVIETNTHTWLSLATGRQLWDEVITNGCIQASGLRADLSEFLPYL